MNTFPIYAKRSMNEQSVLRGEHGVSVAGARDIRRVMNARGMMDSAQAMAFLGTDQDGLNSLERRFVVGVEEASHGPYGRVKWYDRKDLAGVKARRDRLAAGRRPL